MTWAAGQADLSYSYLSRIENDSTVPGPDAVARIAVALDGDLKQMLELADCLPRAILDRILAEKDVSGKPFLPRRAMRQAEQPPATPFETLSVVELAQAAGLTEEEAGAMLEAVQLLCRVPKYQHTASGTLMEQYT